MPLRLSIFICLSVGVVGKFIPYIHYDGNRSNLWKNRRLVATTWASNGFQAATEAAWEKLISSMGDTLEAVVEGCSVCQELRCDGTVGYGGSPDENGETTLDAMVMHGPTGDVGAVAAMKNVKDAIRVAAAVAKYTKHTLIVGESATNFALSMKFQKSDLHTKESVQIWKSWIQNSCQPNYRKNVLPDPRFHCGPYTPNVELVDQSNSVLSFGHDTIGIIALYDGDISVGTSTNGAIYKIPGRVGDSAIPGAGGYVDNDVGAACATGDGDILMRMLPSHQAVENMRNGMSPEKATEDALSRLAKRYAQFKGAVIAVNSQGAHGGACYGFESFSYCLRTYDPDRVQVFHLTCKSKI